MKYLALLLVIIIIFFIYSQTVCAKSGTMEHMSGQGGFYCKNCDELTFGQCLKCSNCGFLSDGYKGKCVKGNFMGPDNKNNYAKNKMWMSGDDFWRVYVNKNYNEKCVYSMFN